MTGLPNRTYFRDALDEAIQTSRTDSCSSCSLPLTGEGWGEGV
ncbi:MAG: hypothetical protein EOM92_03100 [Gammaproteobacteria bacterium]|nr:hypothetical protein [Gammaproteobacteria bacterium]